MSDPSEPKPPSIPTWQRQPVNPNTNQSVPPQTPDSTSGDSPNPSSRDALLEKASKFLDDDEIRAASTERKVSFLEGKGLTTDEVHQLLDATPAKPVTEPAPDEPVDSPQPPSPTSPPPEPHDPIPSSSEKDIPPIITYPEHLFHPRRSPPLITPSRLLNTAYLLSSATAITYGTSKYILSPMLSALTAARHDLLSTTSSNLHTLNSKLEAAVSSLPEPIIKAEEEGEAEHSDEESPNPTTFHHRSTGTQTSPSPSSSPPTTPAPSTPHLQAHTLTTLTSHLNPLLPFPPPPSQSLSQELAALQSYLDSLLPGSRRNEMWSENERRKEDPMELVRTELRLAKGALLSARNFPRVRGGEVR